MPQRVRQRPRIHQRPVEPLSDLPPDIDDEPIKAEQNPLPAKLDDDQKELLDIAYGVLSPQQINAARMEAAGITDRSLIAAQVSVTPQCITQWRTNEHYREVVKINVAIIDQAGRNFRVDCAKQIIAPAYAELMIRMGDKGKRERLDIKEILEVVTKLSKEVRSDTIVATDDNEEDNELRDLQRRRQFLVAKQGEAVRDMVKSGKIIVLPQSEYRVANG
jgi:hypothetical protein